MHVFYLYIFLSFIRIYFSIKKTKFTTVSGLQTPFVRQNTPHPKELKAKAVKLFTRTPEQQPPEKNEAPTTNGLVISPPEIVQPTESVEVSKV